MKVPEPDMCLPAAVKAAIDASFPSHPSVSLKFLTKQGKYERAFGTAIERFKERVNPELKKKGLQLKEVFGDAPKIKDVETLLKEGVHSVIAVRSEDYFKILPHFEVPETDERDIDFHALVIVGIDETGVLVYDPFQDYREKDLNKKESYTSIPFTKLYQMWSKTNHWTFWPADIKKASEKQQKTVSEYE